MIRYLPGADITLSDADLPVNTVNCVGVMGKGVALAFKARFGDAVMRPYRAVIRDGSLRPGRAIPLPLGDGRQWIAMATKDHWRDPSRLEWVAAGLEELVAIARRFAATLDRRPRIALPPPGCGNGGLDWRAVEPLVIRLDAVADLDIHASTTFR